MGIQKIRTQEQESSQLVVVYQKEVKDEACVFTGWVSPERRKTHFPSLDTLALVIDLREEYGAIKIYYNKDDLFLGMIGTEERGFVVVVPWQSEWSFYCLGSLQIGYIKKDK